MIRYPLAPLVEASGLSEAALGNAVGLTGTPLKRAREHGLSETQADRYAVRAGFSPLSIWHDFGLAASQVECPGCGDRFVPVRKSHRYCTKTCYQRLYKKAAYRKKYAANPEFRARELARSKERRETQRRVTAIKKAAYYRRNRDRILAQKKARYYAAKEKAA